MRFSASMFPDHEKREAFLSVSSDAVQLQKVMGSFWKNGRIFGI